MKCCSYLEWRKLLIREDIELCGSMVKRDSKELKELYAIYKSYQPARELLELRKRLCNV